MNRGRGRQQILPGTAYYQDYLRCLDEAHRRFGIEVHAYCLMDNHYHLLVKTPRGNLSRAMRHIDGVYTQRHNRRKKTDGPLFRGRYKSIVIESNSYLLQVSRYIHRNPVELKKPLVKELQAYPWSSYAAYLNHTEPPGWLYRDTVYGELDNPQRYRAYRRYVESGNDEETLGFYQHKKLASIWGSKKFKDEVLIKAGPIDGEVDKKGAKDIVSMDRVVLVVAEHYHLSVHDILNAKRGRGMKQTPRWIAMKLCQENAGAELQEIARLFNVSHYSTVSQTVSRLNRLLEDNSAIRREFNVLSQDLTP
jgi:REP element-mobilizing transposase RayT